MQLLLSLSALIFCVGFFMILVKRHILFILIGIELIFSAANINLITFSKFDPYLLEGQLLVLFIVIVSVCEIAIVLAITYQIYRLYGTIMLDKLKKIII